MMEDVYVRLQKHLDTFVLRPPEPEAILEILKFRFTPEEAEIGLLLDREPKDVPTLAKYSGLAERGLHSIFEEMAGKGLIHKQQNKKDGVIREVYSMLPDVADLWKTSFVKGKFIENQY